MSSVLLCSARARSAVVRSASPTSRPSGVVTMIRATCVFHNPTTRAASGASGPDRGRPGLHDRCRNNCGRRRERRAAQPPADHALLVHNQGLIGTNRHSSQPAVSTRCRISPTPSAPLAAIGSVAGQVVRPAGDVTCGQISAYAFNPERLTRRMRLGSTDTSPSPRKRPKS